MTLVGTHSIRVAKSLFGCDWGAGKPFLHQPIHCLGLCLGSFMTVRSKSTVFEIKA